MPAAALFLGMAGLASGETGRPGETVRAALESAATGLAEGRAADALSALGEARRLEPDNPWIGFYTGSAHLQLGNYHAALKAFDRALDTLSELGDPDPQLTEAIRLRRHAARRNVFGFTLRSGFAYDSNVTYGGSGTTGPQFITDREDGNFAGSLQLDWAPVATDTETLVVGTRLSSVWHFSVQEFNWQDYAANIRYGRRLAENWTGAIRYDHVYSNLNNDSFLCYHNLSPSLTYHWPEGPSRFRLGATTADYSFEPRDFRYETPPELDRDGFANSFGIDQSFLLEWGAKRDWVWILNAGYRFAWINTQGTEFERLVHVFHLGLSIPFDNPLLAGRPAAFRFDVDWEIGDYRNDSLFDRNRDERSDLITTFRFLLSQQLFDDVDWGELTVHGIVDWTIADSNVTTSDGSEPFTWNKLVCGIEFEWSF
jgi:tetratricopeptide (TPR) repeat protein